ncbi:transglutaminase-like domain-containing protein [Kineosporia succinea]|uniref:Transglutaminase-like putative cysteine protease n=1 Tax=Kineosporia succinea TaxID=84632 RepID=A0ABT9P3L7_9ACTN|nr:transglutaminase family protein [Kineosporia succinea]MDP9827268.1 transglutaminase-like putative cysteine protease [Kineosporia succinea]
MRQLAADLREKHPDDESFARAAFEWVRDEIRHSIDARDPRITLTASEVLAEGVGFCYAKSHLLVALLRAQGVPAGFCYQRLTDDGDAFVLHGLISVYLKDGWHRQDPRGNKPGVDARFSLGAERLAFAVGAPGEIDYPGVHAEPAAAVVSALSGATDALVLANGHLPAAL